MVVEPVLHAENGSRLVQRRSRKDLRLVSLSFEGIFILHLFGRFPCSPPAFESGKADLLKQPEEEFRHDLRWSYGSNSTL